MKKTLELVYNDVTGTWMTPVEMKYWLALAKIKDALIQEDVRIYG